MNTLPRALAEFQQNQTIETIICTDDSHCHADPHIKVLNMTYQGHHVTVETENGSFVYSVWVDGEERGVFITSKELNKLIQELRP